VAGTPRRFTPPRPQEAHWAGPEIVLSYLVAAACQKVCAAPRCLKTPVHGPFLRVRLRVDSHTPATQNWAARNPPLSSSERRLGALAARQLGATPPKFSAARPHCGRVPTHATEPLGGLPPLITLFRRGGADRESGVAADVHQQKPCPARPPPPQSPTMSAACTSNGICGHS